MAHTQSMFQMSQGIKIIILTCSSPSSTLIEVDLTSIRDHSFISPGQSLSWKEQVLLMFCTLSVYTVNPGECYDPVLMSLLCSASGRH